MRIDLKRYLLIAIGWLCVALGAVGALLPILPTTPFLILALACFSKSSPRFHKMLLNNKWFGPILTEWEHNKTVNRRTKLRVMALVIASFGLSIFVLAGRSSLQWLLVIIGLIALGFIYRLNESEPPKE